ncbi:hypothetical protein ACFY5D_20805 [Paeniglutamicibacter sp. NPDC012692]|uniref:hypothetical protein n=1 Tax=Paeniglutamicibacter sp. NPDC012692 TaxID=3364388 RepID=UPI00368B85EA
MGENEGMPQPTAQSRYIEMLNGFISPTLREAGWTGYRGKYLRKQHGLLEHLEFQKSRHSGRQTIQFRVNSWQTSEESGELIPQAFEAGPDAWFIMSVAPDFDPEQTVTDVLAHIARRTQR